MHQLVQLRLYSLGGTHTAVVRVCVYALDAQAAAVRKACWCHAPDPVAFTPALRIAHCRCRRASGTYFWGGLVRIDVLEAPPSAQLVFFGPSALRVTAEPLRQQSSLGLAASRPAAAAAEPPLSPVSIIPAVQDSAAAVDAGHPHQSTANEAQYEAAAQQQQRQHTEAAPAAKRSLAPGQSLLERGERPSGVPAAPAPSASVLEDRGGAGNNEAAAALNSALFGGESVAARGGLVAGKQVCNAS